MKKMLLAGIFTLTACGGSGGSDSTGDPKTITNPFSSLVGVWNSSVDEGSDGFDEAYIVISEDGKVSSYDYAGDTFDDWGNCYWIAKNIIQLKSLGGSKYLSTVIYPGLPADAEEVEIKISGNTLTLSGKDTDDIDGDGNTTENSSETMTRSTRTTASFSPECSDTFSVARAQIPAKQPKSLKLQSPLNQPRP